MLTATAESPEAVEGEGAGTEDEGVFGRAKNGHCLCLHFLFDLMFVQLEHSLQGRARHAEQALQALRGGFLFCFPEG